MKTIEHFGNYVADLSVKLQKIRQKQDEERRKLTDLRTLLRNAPGIDKEVKAKIIFLNFTNPYLFILVWRQHRKRRRLFITSVTRR